MTAIPLIDPLQLNPKFSWRTTIHFDELDPMHMLHNSRFAAQIERATVAFYRSLGRTWQRDHAANPDQFHVVRDFRIEYLAPVGPGEIDIEIWVEHLGRTSCVYGFRCVSPDRRILHARGTRAIIKIDPETHEPQPWSEFFQQAHRELLKDLPAMP